MCILIAGGAVAAGAQSPAKNAGAEKIPITTSLEEARRLYLEGRDLADKLRATDSHKLYQEAAAKDKTFALARLGLANTAGTAKEFFDALQEAVTLSGKASEPERLMILGLEAGAKGDVAKQKEYYTKLTVDYPKDERGHNLLGGYYFGQQDYPAAVAAYQKAVAINPSFSTPYNQLGYAYRFMEKYADAEQAFKKYIELIPKDPNPYDSYPEFLMKTGRFAESIETYEKALSLDRTFVASYVGIANDQMFMDRGDEARQTLTRLTGVARNDGERRQALLWSAVSYVHEGATDRALAEVQKMAAIAEAGKDKATQAGDLQLMANILLAAGRADDALLRHREQLATIDQADVPAEVKEGVRRNALFDEARIALARKDVAQAKATAAAYTEKVAVRKIAFEVRQSHELQGMLALEDKRWADAVSELEQANPLDPRVQYLLAQALQGKGEAARARTALDKAANFNALGLNYAYVRRRAKDMLAKS